jgi:phosphomannomutase
MVYTDDSLAEVTALAASGDAGEAAQQLAERFAGRLAFGTAGPCGQSGAGSTGINRAVVREATGTPATWGQPQR